VLTRFDGVFIIFDKGAKKMNVCPKCKTLLDPSTTVCPECGEDLSDYELEEVDVGEPEVLYQARNLAEAQSIVEFLRDNNIPATFLEGTSELSSLTTFKPMSATDIIVGSNSMEEAQELLEEYLNAEPIMEDEWDDDDAEDEEDIPEISQAVGEEEDKYY
jgi:hypothetical protein